MLNTQELSINKCKLPEDGDYAETCRSKLTLKYTMHRVMHLLVLMKFVILLALREMNNMKVVNAQQAKTIH
jgi:hypothetical protein